MASITIYADAVSGYIRGRNAAYATARSTSDLLSTGLNYALGQKKTALYEIWRVLMKFDTSILSGAIINQVNLRCTVYTDNSDADFDIQIVKYDWSGSDPLGAGNRETAYDGVLAAAADDSIWRNTSGMAIETAYTSGNLNTSWINDSGDTYYGLRSSEDKNNSAPAGNEHVYMYSGQTANNNDKQALIIDYDYPALGLLFFT